MYLRGVNLGNWLVLEKWMSPGLFAGTTAEDEYHLPLQLPKDVYEARIRMHRAEYISERDFATIRHMGLNAVRIPVPYFVFGDRAPFLGCVDELDKAFDWAEQYGIQILLDLHSVPLSQNAFDNGGLCGVCRWSQTPGEVQFTLDVLERLAVRYGKRSALLGITPVNEPVTAAIWEQMDVQKRYPAAEPEMAVGSAPNTMAFLRSFYTDAFQRICPHLGPDKWVIFHDGFELHAWEDFVTQDLFAGRVMLDTHQYLMMAEMRGCEQTLDAYLAYIQAHYAEDLAAVQHYVPVICGEWCLFNSMAVGRDTAGGQTVLNGIDMTTARTQLDEDRRREIYTSLCQAQLAAWQKGAGYFYWSYKLLLDTTDPNWYGWDCWDLGKSYALGWFRDDGSVAV